MSVLYRHKLLIACILFLGLCFGFLYSQTPDVSILRSGTVQILREDLRTGEPISVSVGRDSPQWTSIAKTSRFFLNALVVAEDSRFYQHGSLDFREIWNSMVTNWERGRYVRGASTISQQVVRMVFLSREKTILRKLREALGAIVLEYVLTKDEILEWYINLIPFGHSTYGVRQASAYFFRTEPELLTISQSIQLAMVVPGPSIWVQGLSRKKLSELGLRKFAKIANALFEEGYITQTQLRKALASGNFGEPVSIE